MTETYLQDVVISTANIYQTVSNHATGSKYYRVFFDTSNPHTQAKLDAMGRRRNEKGNFLLTNLNHITVTTSDGDYGDLIDDVEVLKIRNLSPDIVFAGCCADLVVKTDERGQHHVTGVVLIR